MGQDPGDNLLRPLVFMVSFLAFFVIMVAMAGPLLTPGSTHTYTDSPYGTEFDAGFLSTNNIWDIGGGGGYNHTMSADDYHSWWRMGGTIINYYFTDFNEFQDFSNPDPPNQYFRTFTVLNNNNGGGLLGSASLEEDYNSVPNYTVVQYNYGWWDNTYRLFSFETVWANWDSTRHEAIVQVSLPKLTFDLHFVPHNQGSNLDALKNDMNNGYNWTMYVSRGVLQEAQDNTGDVWGMMAKLLTFNIVTGNAFLSSIIAIPIWVAVAYVIYRLVVMIIPFT
jgi:hypothetical protein